MSDLIVKAAVKDALSDHNVSADFYDALNEEVERICVLNDSYGGVGKSSMTPCSYYTILTTSPSSLL
jgi:hypothetical protein